MDWLYVSIVACLNARKRGVMGEELMSGSVFS